MEKNINIQSERIPKEKMPTEVKRYVAGMTSQILNGFALGMGIIALSSIINGDFASGVTEVAAAYGLQYLGDACLSYIDESIKKEN